MSTKSRRYEFNSGCFDLRPKPWYIDVFTFGLIVLWMGWTFAAIQQQGASLALVGGAVMVAVVGVLVIYGQRLTYLNIGDRIVVGLRTPEDYNDDEPKQERERYR